VRNAKSSSTSAWSWREILSRPVKQILDNESSGEKAFVLLSVSSKKNTFLSFFTVKSIINIFDCGLQRPFFSLQATRELKRQGKKSNQHLLGKFTYRIYEPYEENLQMIFKNRLKHYPNLQINQTKG
jgi:hypothetical protein